jgi:hypothetical protein
MPNNAEDKKNQDARKPRLVESAGSESDADVITSAPKLESLVGPVSETRPKKSEEQLKNEEQERRQMLDKSMDYIENKVAVDENKAAANEALHKLEVASIHRDSEDFQREQQQAKEAKEKSELYTETVEAAASVDALKNVVDMIGTIETSDGTKMSAKEVKDWIDMAVQFPDSVALNNITRNYGLRDKVIDLTSGALMNKRVEDMGKRVDKAMKAEDSQKETLEALDRLGKAAEKRDRMDAMEKRVDDDMNTDEELDAFLKRGKVIDQLHSAGQSTEKNTIREGIGELNAKELEAAEKASAQMPALDQQLSRAEAALKDRGITDIDEAMAKRAIGGFAEKAKGFFGGLFNKKTRELNSLMETYSSILEARQKAQDAIDKRMPLNDKQKALKRVQNESRGR